jgi:hypothetical protein
MSIVNFLARYFALGLICIMALGFVVILIVKLSGEKSKPMMTESSRFVTFLSAIGILTFLSGLAFVFLPEHSDLNLGVGLLSSGGLALVASLFLNVSRAKAKRAAWPIVAANCTERQLQKKNFSNGDGSSEGWLWQVVCEINFDGKHYNVSPQVNWSDLGQANTPFWSEEKAKQFLSQKIAPNGECKLRINPSNPLEAELL